MVTVIQCYMIRQCLHPTVFSPDIRLDMAAGFLVTKKAEYSASYPTGYLYILYSTEVINFIVP